MHGFYTQLQLTDQSNLSRIRTMSEKYSDVPMDFADVTLLLISELHKIEDIVTIDSDFNIYRNLHERALNNLFIK